MSELQILSWQLAAWVAIKASANVQIKSATAQIEYLQERIKRLKEKGQT